MLEAQVREENDAKVGAYEDKVKLHMAGWKQRYYQVKFHVEGDALNTFIDEIKS